MKAKKAVRKLSKIEAILVEVLERHATIEKNAGDLLASAQLSISQAIEALSVPPQPKAEKKKAAPKGRKKVAIAANKPKRHAEKKEE